MNIYYDLIHIDECNSFEKKDFCKKCIQHKKLYIILKLIEDVQRNNNLLMEMK